MKMPTGEPIALRKALNFMVLYKGQGFGLSFKKSRFVL